MPNARSVSCPRCGAGIGVSCRRIHSPLKGRPLPLGMEHLKRRKTLNATGSVLRRRRISWI